MIRATRCKIGKREVKLNVKKFHFISMRLRRIPMRFDYNYTWRKFILPGKRYVEGRNSEKFINWIIKQLKQTGITVKDSSKYDATSLYMNTYNLNKLHDYISPMIWMNYSPTTCDDLKNNEIGIDLSKVRAR